MPKRIEIHTKDGKIKGISGLPDEYTYIVRKKRVVKKGKGGVNSSLRFSFERLILERAKRGMSERELAFLIARYCLHTVPTQTLIYNWEIGRQAPSAPHTATLCKIFNKPIEYFIVHKDKKFNYNSLIKKLKTRIPQCGPRNKARVIYFTNEYKRLQAEVQSLL